jgi:hypothetical protein
MLLSLLTDDTCRRATVKALIWCSVAFFGPVQGGVSHAVGIAQRESGLQASATSPTGCMGVYQFCPDTWATLIDSWPRMNAALGTNAYNARSNVMRAIRLAHETGWGAWDATRSGR